ncbi:MAG: very short patch repair endonuclease [Bacteroidales bacterium]|nr:very short patch repair endonuclease [Bacteroidales bacterium]
MDTISQEQRSRTMSKIHSKNTKPELLVRRYLYANGFRYRLNVKTLPGSPDIVLAKYHTAIFIHGCFWHSHSCLQGRLPKSNVEFWTNKLNRNHERDIIVREQLTAFGWKTIVVWECQLKPAVREQTLKEIVSILNEINLKQLHKKYQLPESTPIRIAAEDAKTYGE